MEKVRSIKAARCLDLLDDLDSKTIIGILRKYASNEELARIYNEICGNEMSYHLEKAKKYVEKNLLNTIWVEKINLSLRAVQEYRCSISDEVLDAVDSLLRDYAADNDLADDWYYSDPNFTDLEDFFWNLEIDFDK